MESAFCEVHASRDLCSDTCLGPCAGIKRLKRVTKHGDIGNDYKGVMKVGNLCAPLGDFWSL